MKPDPRVLIIIPARFASTRFPGKPLAIIDGSTMIRRVAERCARSCAGAARVLVATDDERIAAEVRSFGGSVVMTPSDLASGTERVAWAARGADADIIVNVQGDEPLLDPRAVDAVVALLAEDADNDIATAAALAGAEIGPDPNIVKVARAVDGHALYFSRSPIPHVRDAVPGGSSYLAHIGIYAFRPDTLAHFSALPPSPLERTEKLEQLRALENGMRIAVAVVDGRTPAVDVPADIERVLTALKHESGN